MEWCPPGGAQFAAQCVAPRGKLLGQSGRLAAIALRSRSRVGSALHLRQECRDEVLAFHGVDQIDWASAAKRR